MILDRTYFTGELSLPNVRSEGSTTLNPMTLVGTDSLEYFIAKYEPEFLDRLLGRKLSKAFMDGLKAENVAQIWLDIQNELYWQTEVNARVFKFSPAANYVYYWTRRSTATQTTTFGEKKGVSDYARDFDESEKLVKAWNDMCEKVKHFRCHFFKGKWDSYKEYADSDYYCWENYFRPINKWDI